MFAVDEQAGVHTRSEERAGRQLWHVNILTVRTVRAARVQRDGAQWAKK
jgi:hypothetical protein